MHGVRGEELRCRLSGQDADGPEVGGAGCSVSCSLVFIALTPLMDDHRRQFWISPGRRRITARWSGCGEQYCCATPVATFPSIETRHLSNTGRAAGSSCGNPRPGGEVMRSGNLAGMLTFCSLACSANRLPQVFVTRPRLPLPRPVGNKPLPTRRWPWRFVTTSSLTMPVPFALAMHRLTSWPLKSDAADRPQHVSWPAPVWDRKHTIR